MKATTSSQNDKPDEKLPTFYKIDPVKEKLLSLLEASQLKWLPAGRAGRQISVSTLYRWIKDGRNGVRLPVLSGATLSTTEQAISWFFLRCSEVANANQQQLLTPSMGGEA